MDDTDSDLIPSWDEFPDNNTQESSNPIKINRNNGKIQCFFLDAKNEEEKLLAEIDKKTNITIISPINTIENSTYYLEPKYDINELVFEGYEVEEVFVDGVSVGDVLSYTISNPSEDHTIDARFKSSTII